MIGQQLGDLAIVSKLGVGGMGTVYLAETDVPDGGREKRAVKIVHPHLLASPGFFKRFLREAEVGRQVTHRNVVRTFDADAIDPDGTVIHYLVMEYVEGKTLRQLQRDLGTVPETILREIALQVAAGLEAIHEKGIVHRDIKPENVLITDDHEVRIMDLGVARLMEESLTLTRSGQFAGSVLYGAPEQFRGEPVGPPADLYSLGVTLYELGTGEQPFRHDHEAAVIEAHLHHVPPPPARRNPELSPFLSELISRLLAKAPVERFASAVELATVLEKSERSTWWSTVEPKLSRVEEARPRIRVRRETELHAREDALEVLRGSWNDARTGRGGVVLIEGEAGIGKTRVLDAFLDTLEGEEMHVLYGSYPPSGGLGGISEAILGKFGEARLSDALTRYLRVTPSLVPAFTSFIRHDAAPRGSEPLPWDAFVAVCIHLMRALADEKPLLWMVDDLHFAPKESRDLFLAMARSVPGRSALLVATARPGLPDDELAHLGRLEDLVRLPLQRLGAREVVELLRSAFRSDALADRLGAKIAYKSDGVPFFVFEMIRGLEQGGYLKRREDDTFEQSRIIDEITVSSAVKDLIQSRLRDVAKGQREILDVGAVQGFSFDPDLVARVLERRKIHVLQDIAQIERQTGLVRGAAGSVEFDQHQIQEVLYAALLPELRREYHTLVADACAERDATAADAEFLASHHLRGNARERALPHLEAALDDLATSYRNEALIELAGRALAPAGLLDDRTRAGVLLHRASRFGLLGRREDERRALTDAIEVADRVGDAGLRANARLHLVQHLNDTSHFEDSIELVQTALEFALAAGDPALQSRAESAWGHALTTTGRYAEAGPRYERSLALAKRAGDRSREAFARSDLGQLAKVNGRYPEAQTQFEKQLEIARRIGDRKLEAMANGNLGIMSKAVGRLEEARAHLERYRVLAREVGDRLSEANATGNLGLVMKNLGRLEEARALFESNLEIAREIGNRLGESIATGHLGLVEKSLGRFEEARVRFERSRTLAREIGDRQGEAIASGNLGNVLFDLGRYEDALAHYEEWREVARDMGDRQRESIALGNLGNALDALGRYEEALRRLEQARGIACEIGDREGEGIALSDLGVLSASLGDPGRGRDLLERSLAILLEVGARHSQGYALHGLGVVAMQAGDPGEARRRFGEALALRREISHTAGCAESELALGRLCAELDRGPEALRHLESAAKAAREIGMPTVFVPAACLTACVTASGREDAASLLAECEPFLGLAACMEARFRLWTATRDRTHLRDAHRLLEQLRAGAPEPLRDPMLENVPLHRAIAEAWAGG